MKVLLCITLLFGCGTLSLAAPAVCPNGWSGMANTTDGSVRCFSFRQERLSPINIDFFCRSLVDGHTPRSVSIHSEDESRFVSSLQSSTQCFAFALGGIVGYGEKAWFDQSTFNYAPTTDIVGGGEGGGCLVSNCDGTWEAVQCSEGSYPFVCALTILPTAPGGETEPPVTTTPPGPTVTGAPLPRPTRPPALSTSCPPQWSFLASTGKCYRFYNNSAYSMQQADSICRGQHPKGRLTSDYDEEENAFLVQLGQANKAGGFFLGALFMSQGAIGSWSEDNVWYDSEAFARSQPSSPAWPTTDNQYYANWALGEPSEAFGCLRISTIDGKWYQTSCQSPIPFACSFLNDGSTFAPTSTKPTTTAPTTTLIPSVACVDGWVGLYSTQRCYRLISQPVTGFRANDACQATIANAPANSIHTTSLRNGEEAPLFAKLMGSASVAEAYVGIAFINYGAEGMFTDLLTDWAPSAALVESSWAIGQPDMESGCVAMARDGSLRAVSCSTTLNAAVCSYSASANMPGGGTTKPPTTTPYPVDMVGTVTSLNDRNHITVASGTRGIYTVQYEKGNVDGKWLLFSPNRDCAFSERQRYAVPIFNGKVAVHHEFPVVDGIVCFSADGMNFRPVNVGFTVVDTALTGIIPTDFNDWRAGRTTSAIFSTPLLSEISIQRRSSGVLYLVGRNVMDKVKAVRFASSPDCMTSLYVYGNSVINVTGELATFELIDIQPLNFSTVQALDNRASTDPVFRYFVCLAVEGRNGDLVFTGVPGLTVTVPVMPIHMDGFVTAGGKINSTLTINQYATPAVQLSATGLNVAMLFYLSTRAYHCSFVEDLPIYPDPYDSQSLRRVSTALPVYVDSSVTGKGAPYIRFTLNHTRLEGFPLTGEDVTFHLCLAMTSYEPPKPTTFKVIIKRQTVTSLLVDGEAIGTNPSPVRTINVGFTGMLQLVGLSFAGMSLETLSTLRVGFAPSSPASVSSAGGNPCSNQSAFYRGMTFPVIDTSPLRNSTTFAEAAIILAPGVINKEVSRKLHVCLSTVHAHDAAVRTFVPTLAYLDIRRIEVLYVGAASASQADDSGAEDYATIVVPENIDHFVLPVSGYGLRADMTLFLTRSPCFLKDRDPDSYMAENSLLNMSMYDLYDVPLSLREETARRYGRSRSITPYIVLTRRVHTDTEIARRLFGPTGKRAPLWMCVRTPGFEVGIVSIPFRFVIRTPYVTSIVRADNPQSSEVTYSSTVDLLISGFGLKEGVTRMVPALDCDEPKSFLWWAAVPLTTVPLTVPGARDYVRSSDAISGLGSFFLSLTPDQTARVGSLTKLQRPNVFKWCARYDPVLPYMVAADNFTVSLPSLDGFTNPSYPGRVDDILNLITVPKKGSDYTAFGVVGSLLDGLPQGQKTFYLAFVPTSKSCESITTNTSAKLNIDQWIVVEDGAAVILPEQIPEVGTHKVCYSTILPTLQMGASYEATLRFVDAKGLRVVVTLPTFVLFSINNTASLTLYTRQEWILPVDGVGISNRTVLRIMNSSNCEPIRGIEDIPVHVAREESIFFGKSAAYYMFVPTETTRALATGKYTVCMLPSASRDWMYTGVTVELKPRVRSPTWYNYFSDEAEGNVSYVLTQFPTKTVKSANTSYIYAAKGAEMSMYLQCGSSACPDRARVILARADSGNADPCFVDEFDFPGEYAKGPFVLHGGILTLTANTTTDLYRSMGVNQNWTLCVETGPSFWRQPQRPHVFITIRDTLPTQVLPAPDDNNNSTFSADLDKSFPFAVSAGGPTKVFFVNGVGIRRGTLLRFGPSCDATDDATLEEAAASMRNPQLLTEPIFVTDKRGAFFLKGSYYPLQEENPLPMCYATIDPASGALGPFQLSRVLLTVGPSTHRTDDVSGAVDISHTPQGALRDTIQIPCMGRGTIELVNLTTRRGATYDWTAGSILMFSRDCKYNTEGTALLQVDVSLRVSITRNHTRYPTASPLLVCVRRLITYETMTETGVVRHTAFETSMFVESGFKFQVAAVMVDSVSVSPMAPLSTGGNDDVRFVVAVRSQEELVLKLTLLPAPRGATVASSTTKLAAATKNGGGGYFDGILDRMTDPAALVAFGLLKVAAGRPCSRPESDDDVATVRSLTKQEVRFNRNGTVAGHLETYTSSSNDEYYVNLKQYPVGTWGDPMQPKSLCMSADGGRSFVSVGIAVFDVEWAPTLAIISSNPSTGQPQVLNEVNVYENTEVAIEVVDSRYSKYFKDLRDQTTAALARFAELALWDGFINQGFGVIESMKLILASSYLSPGESRTSPLLFTSDALHSGLNTGIKVSLLPIQLKCAESGSSQVYGHHLEPGATYDITPGVCAFGLNDGSMVRYAPDCDNASHVFIGDGIITGNRLTSPATVAFIDQGTYEVCVKKYLDPADVVGYGAEAEYVRSGLTLVVSSRVGVSAVNDVNSGTLSFFQNEPAVLALSGSGIGNGNIILSFPPLDSNCNAATKYVDGSGHDTMSAIDPFAIWVGVTNSIGVVNRSSTRKVTPGAAGVRRVCVSNNGGISFSGVGKVDQPLLAMVVPPTITGVSAAYDPMSQSSTTLSVLRLVTGKSSNGTAEAPETSEKGPKASIIPSLNFFKDDETNLIGNGIGSFSQRTEPLVAALFPAVQLEACNGYIDPSVAVVLLLEVDAATGKAKRKVSTVSSSSLVSSDSSRAPAELPAAPSAPYVVCTSADNGETFYSANADFLPSSSSKYSKARKSDESAASTSNNKKASDSSSSSHDIGVTDASNAPSVESYVTNVLVSRFEENFSGNRRDDDATLILDTFVFAPNGTLNSANFTAHTFDLDTIQSAFAAAIGVSPGFVAIVVTPMMPLSSSRPVNASHEGYTISVKLIASCLSTVWARDGSIISRTLISPVDAYGRWVGLFTAEGSDSDDAYRRSNLTASIQANMTSAVRVAIIKSSFACSDGWPATAKDTPRLMGMSVDLVGTTIRGYGGQQEIGSTHWGTIPILLLFPCFMVVATYFAYKRYFGIIDVPPSVSGQQQTQAGSSA